MTTIFENVDSLVGEVKGETTNIFDQMRGVYNGAMSQALQSISASVDNVNTDIDEPGTPVIAIDFVTAKNYIDDLQDAFLNRPAYPTFNYGNTPNLPGLSTTPPGLTTVTLPDVPSINMPEFSAELESEVITLPDVEFDYQEIAYSSGLHDALWNQLLSEISNGGYGINDDDESRLFERAREREQKALQGEVEGAIRPFSSAGFTMPHGAALAAVQRAQAAAREKISSLNRDIMVERSKLYLEGKKINQEGTLRIEQNDSQLHSAKQDRALKAAAQQVTSILEISAFQLERIKMFLEKYKTLAFVFETKVKAEGLKADIYRVQVDAAKVQVELNKSLLDEFIARNNALVDVFKAQVQEYVARIDGYSKYISALSDQYRADASAYAAAVDGYGRAFDLQAKSFGGQVDYYTAVVNSRTAVKRMALDRALAEANISLDGAKAEANAAAMVVGAALSAMNVNATMSAGVNLGMSTSSSESEAINEYHNYNHPTV